jgi:cysteine-rich repeat protein
LVCLPCDIGTYAASGADACTACEPGTYGDVEESEACSECPENTFAAGSGNTVCTPCPDTYYSAAGSAACVSDCGNGGVDDTETCDDGGQEAYDGCSDSCEIETYNDLAAAHADINFSALRVGALLDLHHPELDATDAALSGPVRLALAEGCSCAWLVTPSARMNLTEADACETQARVGTAGLGNLRLTVTCPGVDVATYNQSFLSRVSIAGAGPCELNDRSLEWSINSAGWIIWTFFGALAFYCRRKKAAQPLSSRS